MRIPIQKKNTTILLVAGLILIVFGFMVGLFFYTSRQQSIVSDTQRSVSRFYLNWTALNKELYSSSFDSSNHFPLLMRLSNFEASLHELYSTEQFKSLILMEEDLERSYQALFVKWPYIKKNYNKLLAQIDFPKSPAKIHDFLSSPLVLSFEQDLKVLDEGIYRFSRETLRHFQILNNLIVIFLFILLFGMFLSYYAVRQRHISAYRIRSLTQSLLKVQEEEKKQLAYNLHDDIVQDLASLKMRLENISSFSDPGGIPPAEIKPLTGLLQKIIQTTRRISGSIRPYNLDHLGLVGAIRVICDDLAKESGIHVQFLPVGMDNIQSDYTTQINLYRITQEALQNIRKHSSATQATVRLIASSPHIILRIKDNGRGFNIAQVQHHASYGGLHIGLTSIEERTHLLHGELKIHSSVGEGSEVRVKVPAQHDVQ